MIHRKTRQIKQTKTMQPTLHIFKTNINSIEQIKKADLFLSTNAKVKKWNIDIEDCDKVLKIESSQLETVDIIGNLKSFNIYCEVLE